MTGSNRKTTKRLPIENWKINNNSMANIEFEADKKLFAELNGMKDRNMIERMRVCVFLFMEYMEQSLEILFIR